MNFRARGVLAFSCVMAALLLPATASSQALQGEALVKALRQGGFVIVMRHAFSPRDAPDKLAANPGNVKVERQLDATGRATAIAMGRALRDLKIPLGIVLSSPTYRALETVRYAEFGKPQTVEELGDGGRSMQAWTETQTAWLQKRAAQFPKGSNTIIITHLPNITGAFPEYAEGLVDGDALVFGPNGKGGISLVARVRIGEWPALRP